jgi:hypothetical protein
MNHLTSEEIVAASEATLDATRQAHLDACGGCRMQVGQFAALLREVQAVAVPEPSPLFWDRFSDQVRTAIVAEPAPRRLLRWFEWPVLAPLGALALLVIALASAVPRTTLSSGDAIADASTSMSLPFDVPADEEAHWQLMAALLSDVDIAAADEAGITAAPGAADDAVLQMSSAEQEELLRLLREELGHSGG